MTTVRPIASLAELARLVSVITAQFPPRRGTPSHGTDVLRRRFAEDRSLMLVAERDGVIVDVGPYATLAVAAICR